MKAHPSPMHILAFGLQHFQLVEKLCSGDDLLLVEAQMVLVEHWMVLIVWVVLQLVVLLGCRHVTRMEGPLPIKVMRLVLMKSSYEEGIPLMMKCWMLMVSDLVVLLLGQCCVLKGVVLSWCIEYHHQKA